MTAGSDDRPPSEHLPQAREQAPPQSTAQQRERFGPLELLRTNKADGRALLLFSRRREQGKQ